MKLQRLISFVCLLPFVLSGCHKNDDTSAPSALPEKAFVISASDTMQYDITAIDARADQPCKITLKNVGTLPKVSMGHNLILLKLHTDASAFLATSATHGATEYIDPAQTANVIANTKLLGPGETDTVSFPAPHVSGNYDFICSFPGHYAAGMKGVLVVYP